MAKGVRSAIGVAAAVTAMGVAGGASAGGDGPLIAEQNLKDPRGDTSPAFTDIRKIGASALARDRIKFFVKVDKANRATLSLTQLAVTTRKDFFLIDSAGATKLASPGRQAEARRRGNRIVFKVPEEAVGSPKKLAWAATVGSNDTSPERFDQAPDKGLLRYKVR